VAVIGKWVSWNVRCGAWVLDFRFWDLPPGKWRVRGEIQPFALRVRPAVSGRVPPSRAAPMMVDCAPNSDAGTQLSNA
jgi:hypothetical protein